MKMSFNLHPDFIFLQQQIQKLTGIGVDIFIRMCRESRRLFELVASLELSKRLNLTVQTFLTGRTRIQPFSGMSKDGTVVFQVRCRSTPLDLTKYSFTFKKIYIVIPEWNSLKGEMPENAEVFQISEQQIREWFDQVRGRTKLPQLNFDNLCDPESPCLLKDNVKYPNFKIVTGHPGSGKTHLVVQFIQKFPDRKFGVIIDTNAVKGEWTKLVEQYHFSNVTVYTRYRVPFNQTFDTLILDNVNILPAESFSNQQLLDFCLKFSCIYLTSCFPEDQTCIAL